MPIMSAHTQNDARGTARLLALSARDTLRSRDMATASEVALNNAYRFLEAFRVNPRFGSEPNRKEFP
jgi:hypothetical protein